MTVDMWEEGRSEQTPVAAEGQPEVVENLIFGLWV